MTHHPFIVGMDYAFQTPELGIMCLELVTGGDLQVRTLRHTHKHKHENVACMHVCMYAWYCVHVVIERFMAQVVFLWRGNKRDVSKMLWFGCSMKWEGTDHSSNELWV